RQQHPLLGPAAYPSNSISRCRGGDLAGRDPDTSADSPTTASTFRIDSGSVARGVWCSSSDSHRSS
ncbi:MAG: hypothetical protein K8J09_08010, partial [Planctomycetes bacterium]|nr:hypothetical protein [Planctomycetota bacterium]